MTSRIAIIGAGPAGLSLARLLHDIGIERVTLFEADQRVGGKSLSFYHGKTVVEMGTCYTSLAHRTTKKWMKSFGFKLIQNGVARYDGAEFMDYVRKGGGAPFAIQALRFIVDGASLRRRLKKAKHDPATVEEAAQTIQDWLRARNLPKMERFLHRVQTAMGYGALDQTPAVQAHRWCDLSMLATGALNQIHAPDSGWTELWNRLATPMDVRLSTPIERIERCADCVRLTANGQTEAFDYLVIAAALDDIVPLIDNPTKNETRVRDAIDWHGYTTTLIAADDWFKDVHLEAWSDAVRPGAAYGQLIGGRLEGFEPDLGGHLYVTGQLSKGMKDDDLKEIMVDAVAKQGASIKNIIMQKNWRFFPQYKPEAVANGLLQTMRDMQGDHRTWYTGATFSFEAVSHIVAFNQRLARQMHSALKS